MGLKAVGDTHVVDERVDLGLEIHIAHIRADRGIGLDVDIPDLEAERPVLGEGDIDAGLGGETKGIIQVQVDVGGAQQAVEGAVQLVGGLLVKENGVVHTHPEEGLPALLPPRTGWAPTSSAGT